MSSKHCFQSAMLSLLSLLMMHAAYSQDKIGANGTRPAQPVIKDPSVSKFQKLDFSEVNYFTGSPVIEMPLHEIKLKNFTLPIKLSYDANDVKPGNITGPIGLGWKLVAGGSIDRTVNDVPDDVIMKSPGGGRGFVHGFKYGYIYGGKEKADFFKGRLDNRHNIPAHFLEIGFANYAQDMFLYSQEGIGPMNNCGPQLFPTITKGFYRGHDTGPDWFSMNINGESSSFLLGDYLSRNIRFVRYDNMDGRYSLDSTFHPNPGLSSYDYMKGITGFTIIDKDGNQFNFSVADKMKVYGRLRDVPFIREDIEIAGNNYYGDVGLSSEYYSSWHLSSIITADNERIDFEYEQEKVYIYEKSYYSRELDNSIDYTTVPFKVGNATGVVQNDKISMTRIEKIQHRLKRIVSGITVIDLSYLEQRPDLLNSRCLTGLSVSNKLLGAPEQVRSYSLIYRGTFGYSDNSSSYQATDVGDDPNISYMMSQSWNFPNDRVSWPHYYPLLLMLDETVSNQQHLFNYNLPGQCENFPHTLIDGLYLDGFTKNSFDVDCWGYYNGSPAGYPKMNKNPYPTTYVHPTLNGPDRFSIFPFNDGTPEYVLPGANREVSPSSITVGTLRDILYPTGGIQSFEFEANQFLYRGATRNGGGMRIKKISLSDSTGKKVYSKRYEYHTSDWIYNEETEEYTEVRTTTGHLFNMPIFAYNENMPRFYSRYHNNTIINPGATFANDPAAYYNSATWRCEQPYYSRGNFEMTTVGYDRVREYLDANNDMGYIEYTFSVPASIDNPQQDDLGLFRQRSVIPLNKSIYYSIFFMYGCDEATRHLLSIEASTGSAMLNYMDVAEGAYGAGPALNYDWNRGHLLSKKKFPATSAQPIETEEYQYEFIQKDPAGSRYPGIAITKRNNAGLWQDSPFYDYLHFVTCSPYEFITNVCRVVKQYKKTRSEGYGIPITIQEDYIYDGYAQIMKVVASNSARDIVTTSYTYPYSYAAPGNTDPILAGIKNLLNKHVLSKPVETYTILERANGERTVTKGAVQFFNPQKCVVDSIKEVFTVPFDYFAPSGFAYQNGRYEFIHSPYYIKGSYFDAYGTYNNLMESHEDRKSPTAYLWGYHGQLMTARTVNAIPAETAHESFEASPGETGFELEFYVSAEAAIVTDHSAPTGNKVVVCSGLWQTHKYNLNPQKRYIVSGWVKGGAMFYVAGIPEYRDSPGKTRNGWSYHEYEVGGNTSLTIISNGTGWMDELRVYPADAQMTTYSHEPDIGVTAISDLNSNINYFRYDNAGRLMQQLNDDGHIIKQFCYSLYNSGGDCMMLIQNGRASSSQALKTTTDAMAITNIVPVETKTCYVKLEAKDPSSAGDEFYRATFADYYLRFYENEACTLPLTLQQSKKIVIRRDYQMTDSKGAISKFSEQIEVEAPTGVNEVLAGNFPDGDCYSNLSSGNKGGCTIYQHALVAGNGYLVAGTPPSSAASAETKGSAFGSEASATQKEQMQIIVRQYNEKMTGVVGAANIPGDNKSMQLQSLAKERKAALQLILQQR